MKPKNKTNTETDTTLSFYESISGSSPGKEGDEIKDQDCSKVFITDDQNRQIAIVCDGVSSSPKARLAADYMVEHAIDIYNSKGIKTLVDGLQQKREELLDSPVNVDESVAILRHMYEDIIKDKYRNSYQTTFISISLSWNEDRTLNAEAYGCGDSGLFIFTQEGNLIFNNLALENEISPFKHTSPRTDLLPDNFNPDTKNILKLPKLKDPSTVHFLLCSDGFYDGFTTFKEIFDWLNNNQKGLLEKETKNELLDKLHQQLTNGKGDDDISFIWLRPKKLENKKGSLTNGESNKTFSQKTEVDIRIKNASSNIAVSFTLYLVREPLMLITALLATLFGMNAFAITLKPNFLVICYGLFWGTCIYSINRMMSINVATKRVNQIAMTLPTVLISLLLAIIISKSIELKLFEAEIEAESSRVNCALSIIANNYIKQNLDEIKYLEKQNENYLNEIEKGKKKKEEFLQQLQQLLPKENVAKKLDTSSNENFQQMKEKIDSLQIEVKMFIEETSKKVDVNKHKILLLKTHLKPPEVTKLKFGLLEQLSILSELIQKQSFIFWIDKFIILLLLLGEFTPVCLILIYDADK